MDLSDTHKEAARVVSQAESVYEEEARRLEIAKLKEELKGLREELDFKENSTFKIEETSDTYRDIQRTEDLVDRVITRILEKGEIKTDDINVAMGVLAIMEKYRTMKTNCYSVIKFKYPTGERI